MSGRKVRWERAPLRRGAGSPCLWRALGASAAGWTEVAVIGVPPRVADRVQGGRNTCVRVRPDSLRCAPAVLGIAVTGGECPITKGFIAWVQPRDSERDGAPENWCCRTN